MQQQPTLNQGRWHTGGVIYPFNVASGLVACTLNTRYEMMAIKDIFSLRHFPKTVVLIEHGEL